MTTLRKRLTITHVMAVAMAHAKRHWCWDDEAFIKEWAEKEAFYSDQEVTKMVDELADDYDLTPAPQWLTS